MFRRQNIDVKLILEKANEGLIVVGDQCILDSWFAVLQLDLTVLVRHLVDHILNVIVIHEVHARQVRVVARLQ